jgi:hypothetical protein
MNAWRSRGSQLSSAIDAERSLAFHIGETTVSFPFEEKDVTELSAALQGLLATFAAKQRAERPKRWDMMEYRYEGGCSTQKKCNLCLLKSDVKLSFGGRELRGTPHSGTSGELAMLEAFCNPNAYSTAFEAKVLINLRTTGMPLLLTWFCLRVCG